MFRKFGFFLLAVFFVAGCGSAPKTAQTHSKKKYRNYSYYDSGDPANQDSIEDVIYSELAKRQKALLSKYQIPTTVHSLKGVKFDIPVTINDRVSTWIDYFANGSGRKHFERYLSRSTRFVPTQLSILKEVGVPKDLIFLSMIESGFNTHAYSSAAASGLWQFIRSTGRLYGLVSDYWIDERRDPVKATTAAAQHLKDLYGEFGDWYLAFAAYNAGAGKVRRAIAATGSNNFWDLANSSYLRQETKDYVPKILAAAIISKSPEKYGFENVIYQDPIATEKVNVSTPTDVDVIAECAGVDADLIRLVNPELVRNMTPPDRPNYEINIPRGTRSLFEKKYARLSPAERLKYVQYVARNGDTLRGVAAENGVSVASLMNANPSLGSRLHSGQSVVIPRAYDSPPSVPMSSMAYPTATKGSRLLDLIADNSDRKPEKNKKKKEKHEKEIAKEAGPSGDELKVAWKENTVSPKEEAKPVSAEVPVSNNAEVKTDVKTVEAPASPNPVNLENPVVVAKTDAPESNSANGDSAAANGSNDTEIANALNKVGVPSENNDAAGVVRVKTSGQVASAEKGKKNTEKTTVLKVKRGESLTQIADRYGVTVAELKDWNNIKGKGNVLVGQKIIVKSSTEAKSLEKESRVAANSGNKNGKLAKKSSPKVIAYKVKKGDTLNKIAKRYDVTPSEISGLNGLSRNALLKPGVVIKIKARSAQDEG